MFQQFLLTAFPEPLRDGLVFAFTLAPIWLPVFLGIAFVKLWMVYVRTERRGKYEFVLLEIRFPNDITHSPAAMETFLDKIYHTGEGDNFVDFYLYGSSRPWFSLEIASIEGQVRFFVWTQKKFTGLLQTALYGAYPGAELNQTEDYTRTMPFDLNYMDVFGLEFKLQKADPYPIKTYIDFGLNMEHKEEFKVDPMAGMLEFMGSIGKGEQLWLQIVLRAHVGDDKKKPGTLMGNMNWKEEADAEIKNILAKYTKPNGDPAGFMDIPKGEQMAIEAISRNVAKKPFDIGMRFLYLATKERFKGERRSGLPTVMRTFETHDLNGLKPIFVHLFDFWWKDPKNIRSNRIKRQLYEGYRYRSYFYPPYKRPHFVLSSEELATIFHLPGSGVSVPTMARIPSHRHEAPANLPV